MNKKVQTAKFVFADLLSAAIAWSIFFFLRKSAELQAMNDTLQIVLNDDKFYFGVITIPVLSDNGRQMGKVIIIPGM